MIKNRLIKLETSLVKLVKIAQGSDYDFNEFEAQVYKIDEEINDLTDEASQTELFWRVGDLIADLNALKKETNFFDEEDVLDLMSPNIDDDHFDEESVSFDNV
tara:strand:+ start:339 stop:647 length:309 start_codon:yes stop_codon:yes gene_type:complete